MKLSVVRGSSSKRHAGETEREQQAVSGSIDEIPMAQRRSYRCTGEHRRLSATQTGRTATVSLSLKWESQSPREEESKTLLMRNRRLFIVADAIDHENGDFSIRS